MVLLDLGSGAIGPLQRLVDPARIDAVVVSHAHGDHCADLAQLAYLRQRAGAPALPIVGPSDLPDAVPSLRDQARWEFTPARQGTQRLGSLSTRFVRTDHAVETWAIRFGDEIAFTADTGPSDDVADLAARCRILLAEAAGFDGEDLRGHLTAGEAGRLAASTGSGLLVLTHLRPWHDPTALLAEAIQHAPCPVLTAATGLRIQVPQRT